MTLFINGRSWHHQYKGGTINHHKQKERYYDQLAKILINSNVRSDGTINNDKLNEAITQLKSEKEAEHERNILNMKQVNEYMSPRKNKYASTVNDSAYHNSDEYEDKISDLSKQVDASKDPISDTYVRNTSVGTTSVDPDVIGVGIIVRWGRGINQGMINRGTGIISSNIITDILTDSSKMILKSDTFPLDPFRYKTLVVASQN